MAALRYLLFAVVGLVVASVLFLAFSFIVTANFDAGVGFVERWIVKATCDQYELSGTVRDIGGQPVPYAVVEVSYPDQRLSTRSNTDGSFKVGAAEAVCDRRPPTSVQLIVVAEDYRPKRQSLPFEASTVEVTMDARDFRP